MSFHHTSSTAASTRPARWNQIIGFLAKFWSRHPWWAVCIQWLVLIGDVGLGFAVATLLAPHNIYLAAIVPVFIVLPMFFAAQDWLGRSGIPWGRPSLHLEYLRMAAQAADWDAPVPEDPNRLHLALILRSLDTQMPSDADALRSAIDALRLAQSTSQVRRTITVSRL